MFSINTVATHYCKMLKLIFLIINSKYNFFVLNLASQEKKIKIGCYGISMFCCCDLALCIFISLIFLGRG